MNEVDGMGKSRKNPYNENHPKIKYYEENDYNYYIIGYNDGSIFDKLVKVIKL